MKASHEHGDEQLQEPAFKTNGNAQTLSEPGAIDGVEDEESCSGKDGGDGREAWKSEDPEPARARAQDQEALVQLWCPSQAGLRPRRRH